MQIHYDEKGKFFTEIISKEPIAATIQTLTHRVQGNVFVRKGERLIDGLLASGQFLAITKAQVLNSRGETIVCSDFLTVNRDHIVWIAPQNELAESAEPGEDK